MKQRRKKEDKEFAGQGQLCNVWCNGWSLQNKQNLTQHVRKIGNVGLYVQAITRVLKRSLLESFVGGNTASVMHPHPHCPVL
jgi:hypothetical protein